ncbi:hypothetical protein HDU98_010439 [Podochytrium sp. JEL0797]|nr:hypothetical protein HDU98_010439 [Podochytrium sp. JEL0797]
MNAHTKLNQEPMADIAYLTTNCHQIEAIHNTLRRGNGSLIAHCDASQIQTPKKLRSFLGFLHAYMQFLHHHHHNEDAFYFPVLAAHGMPTDHLTAEHKTLEPMMEYCSKMGAQALDKSARKTLDPKTFNFTKLKQELQALADVLHPHLALEESTQTVDVFVARNVTTEALKACHAEIMKETQKEDPTIGLAYLMMMVNEEEKKLFAQQMPWFLVKVMLPIFVSVHKDYWQFSYAKQQKKA